MRTRVHMHVRSHTRAHTSWSELASSQVQARLTGEMMKDTVAQITKVFTQDYGKFLNTGFPEEENAKSFEALAAYKVHVCPVQPGHSAPEDTRAPYGQPFTPTLLFPLGWLQRPAVQS